MCYPATITIDRIAMVTSEELNKRYNLGDAQHVPGKKMLKRSRFGHKQLWKKVLAELLDEYKRKNKRAFNRTKRYYKKLNRQRKAAVQATTRNAEMLVIGSHITNDIYRKEIQDTVDNSVCCDAVEIENSSVTLEQASNQTSTSTVTPDRHNGIQILKWVMPYYIQWSHLSLALSALWLLFKSLPVFGCICSTARGINKPVNRTERVTHATVTSNDDGCAGTHQTTKRNESNGNTEYKNGFTEGTMTYWMQWIWLWFVSSVTWILLHQCLFLVSLAIFCYIVGWYIQATASDHTGDDKTIVKRVLLQVVSHRVFSGSCILRARWSDNVTSDMLLSDLIRLHPMLAYQYVGNAGLGRYVSQNEQSLFTHMQTMMLRSGRTKKRSYRNTKFSDRWRCRTMRPTLYEAHECNLLRALLTAKLCDSLHYTFHDSSSIEAKCNARQTKPSDKTKSSCKDAGCQDKAASTSIPIDPTDTNDDAQPRCTTAIPLLVMDGKNPRSWYLSSQQNTGHAFWPTKIELMPPVTHVGKSSCKDTVTTDLHQKDDSKEEHWQSEKIADKDYREQQKGKSPSRPDIFQEIITPSEDDKQAIEMLPLLVVEITKKSFRCARTVKYEGGLHWKRRNMIAKVIIIEADFNQAYLTRWLHVNPHYQILREDLDAFLEYCNHPQMGVPFEYVKRTDCYYDIPLDSKFDHSDDHQNIDGFVASNFIFRAMNLTSGGNSSSDLDGTPDWYAKGKRLVDHEVSNIDFQAISDVAMEGSDHTTSERGNFQISMGCKMLDYDDGSEDGISKPQLCEHAKGGFKETFCQASRILQAFDYKFPDGDERYEACRDYTRTTIGHDCRIDAMTCISTQYCWEPPTANNRVPSKNDRDEKNAMDYSLLRTPRSTSTASADHDKQEPDKKTAEGRHMTNVSSGQNDDVDGEQLSPAKRSKGVAFVNFHNVLQYETDSMPFAVRDSGKNYVEHLAVVRHDASASQGEPLIHREGPVVTSQENTSSYSPSSSPCGVLHDTRSGMFAYLNILRCHTDQGNANDPGRDFSLGITKVGRLWKWSLDPTDGYWKYIWVGYVRTGVTAYPKNAVSCTGEKSLWLQPLIKDYADFFFTQLQEWQRDLSKMFLQSGNWIPLHANIMSLISTYVSPVILLNEVHPLSWERVVEAGFILVVANAPQRMEDEVLSWRELAELPAEHLGVFYVNRTRMKYGSAAGGKNPRAQISFTKPVPLSKWYLATKRVGDLINHTNANVSKCRTKVQIRNDYRTCCQKMEKIVPGAGDLVAQRMVKFYTALGLIHEPSFLTFAYIPRNTMSGQRVVDAIEHYVGDRGMAEAIFKSPHQVTLLQGLARLTKTNEATAENIICKCKLETDKLEFVHPARIVVTAVDTRQHRNAGVKAKLQIMTKESPEPHDPTFLPFAREADLRKVDPTRTQRHVSWETICEQALCDIPGQLESHITASEFGNLVRSSARSEVEQAQALWSAMTDDRRRKIQVQLSPQVALIIMAWNTTKSSDDCYDDSPENNGPPTKKRKRLTRTKTPCAVKLSSAPEDGECMKQCMSGKASGTELPLSEIQKLVQYEDIYPSPWSPTAYKEKPKKGRTEAEKTKANIETLVAKLQRLNESCKTPHRMMVPSAGTLETSKFRLVSTSYTDRAAKRGIVKGFYREVSDETISGNDNSHILHEELKHGIYKFDAGYLVHRCFTGMEGGADFRYYRFFDPVTEQWGYYVTIVWKGKEYDYSWARILNGMLPGVANFEDLSGRTLYTSYAYAKVATALNASLDVSTGDSPSEEEATLRRLQGDNRLFSDLLNEKGRSYLCRSRHAEDAKDIRYLILRLAGWQEDGKSADKTMLILIEQSSGEKLLCGYKDGIGTFIPRNPPHVRTTPEEQERAIRSHETTVWCSLLGLHDHGKVCDIGKPSVPHAEEYKPTKSARAQRRRREGQIRAFARHSDGSPTDLFVSANGNQPHFMHPRQVRRNRAPTA